MEPAVGADLYSLKRLLDQDGLRQMIPGPAGGRRADEVAALVPKAA